MFHHCSVRSSTLYGEEDPPIHLLCLLSPLLGCHCGPVFSYHQKERKMTLTITALARVGEKERKFPELSAYYYVLSVTSGCIFFFFCSRSSFLFSLLSYFANTASFERSTS